MARAFYVEPPYCIERDLEPIKNTGSGSVEPRLVPALGQIMPWPSVCSSPLELRLKWVLAPWKHNGAERSQARRWIKWRVR